MFRSLPFLLLTFALTGLFANFQVQAQDIEPRQTRLEQQTERTDDMAVVARQDAITATQMASNTAAIAEVARMTGTQDFILKLLSILMPLLTAIIAGVLLYFQVKQKQASEHRSVAARDDLILVARSVNGMKTELVAKSELAAFLEATHHMNENGKLSPNAEIRLAELQEAVKYATEKANAVAATAITELTAKQKGRMAITSVPLAHGEQKTVEGVDFGDKPLNPEAIAVATGETKNVVGVPA